LIFTFIRYTRPSWQFNLLPKTKNAFASCYVSAADCPANFLDNRYQTESAKLADAGYRLFFKGVLLQSTQEEIKQLNQLQKPSLRDEYIFIRKYWGSVWAMYTLLIRLITFKNPFEEVAQFIATKKVKKINVHAELFVDKSYTAFQSQLIGSNPLVAVIIPTLNRYKYLKDVLTDLEKQTYTNFEVIIVDQTDDFQQTFYDGYNLNIKLIRQEEKLLWTARNNAVKNTTAQYLLFFDDDSRVEPGWIHEHLKCIDFFNADISAGVSFSTSGGKISESYNYFRWADQFDSGNALIKRSVMQQIGMFDEQFNGQRMGDGEFGYRAYINGIKSISNPNAFRVHLKVSSGGLREMGSWDGFRPTKWFAPKPLPSVLYLYEKYLPQALFRNAVFMGIMLSNVSYRHKGKSKMLAVSILLGIIKSPLLFIQYYRSTQIAERMLRNAMSPEILE